MKHFLFLMLILLGHSACDKGDCTTEIKTLASGETRLDPNPASPYYLQPVVDTDFAYEAEVERGTTCKSTTCLELNYLKVKNICSKDIDITLTLAGKGDHTFSIAQGQTVEVFPRPDFCLENSWGRIKHVEYK
jgi:hypothetical protein